MSDSDSPEDNKTLRPRKRLTARQQWENLQKALAEEEPATSTMPLTEEEARGIKKKPLEKTDSKASGWEQKEWHVRPIQDLNTSIRTAPDSGRWFFVVR